ncbi:MAG: hypothetical protein GY774_08160 [Planctomycetes bacterium]|nr:hypothetical protein [Planctomycetota bacterium]
MRVFIVFILCCISISVRAENIAYIGLMKEEINQSGVAEIGIRTDLSENILGSVSLMWFGHEDNVYNGANASVGFTFGSDLKLYAGFGGFVGEYEACTYSNESNENVCESDFTGGLYPEVALQASIYKLRLGAYTRYYRTFDAGNNEYRMFGLYVGYEL